nr:immunoglobulin heavy chain junction region [Macaca mulatta]
CARDSQYDGWTGSLLMDVW